MKLPHQCADGVRFTYEGAPGVTSVAVAGTFNSWVGNACMMQRTGPTTWQATLPIAPGRHHYKFVVDARLWILDPANPWVSEDAQNNSSISVDEQGGVSVWQGEARRATPSAMYRRHAAVASPQWLRDGVIYQLSVPAFGGTFDGVRARLGHLEALGVDVVWIMPVQPVGIERRIGQAGDPYAVRDFLAIDPQLGDAAALRALVDDLHARGMRVILDWTLNRASCDNVLIGEHPEWFTRDAEGHIHYAVPNREYFAGFDFSNRELRAFLTGAMQLWLDDFDIDGFRFDDSDITPLDFLDELRAALVQVRPDIALISQSTDEYHHIAACDLTYDGGVRALAWQIAAGEVDADSLRRYWEESTHSFPRGSLRMRWLEEKEQGRAHRYFGAQLHLAASALLLTLDGVPHILMGQEFNERRWTDWTWLFKGEPLDWAQFDEATFAHYRALIALRRRHAALRAGDVEFISTGVPGLVAYIRAAAQEKLLVIVNLSEQQAALPVMAACAETLHERGLAGASLAGFGSYVGRLEK